MDIFSFTRELIDIPSVSNDEGAVTQFLMEYLNNSGYRTEMQEVSAGRDNLIATVNETPAVVFSTHLDTVPPFIPSSEDSEYIYGRGACDAKGIIAAQIFAANRLRADGIENIGLLFIVDEELGSIGARVANQHPLAARARFLINGEPTENLLALGSKGSLRVKIVTKGHATHSAYFEYGESAIEKLLTILNNIRESDWPVDDFFGPTTCNIGTVNGGVRPNVVPDYAESEMQIRLVGDLKPVKDILESAASGLGTIEYMSVTEPVRMLGIDGFDSTVVRFTTDIPHLSRWGQPLLLGPGSILDAHTAGERISKRQLSEAVDLYYRLAKTLIKI
jgi:acetylornithine deacetylase